MVKKYLQVFTLEMAVKTPISYIFIKDDMVTEILEIIFFVVPQNLSKKFCLLLPRNYFLFVCSRYL